MAYDYVDSDTSECKKQYNDTIISHIFLDLHLKNWILNDVAAFKNNISAFWIKCNVIIIPVALHHVSNLHCTLLQIFQFDWTVISVYFMLKIR
jgi:hypothetical protein